MSIAFLVDASTHVYESRTPEWAFWHAEYRLSLLDFSRNYSTASCKQYDDYWKMQRSNSSTPVNVTGTFLPAPCTRDISLLYILLTLGTVWLGTFLYKFKQTPYLTSAKRELLTDYALPVSVIIMSLVGSLFFSQINGKSDEVLLLKFVFLYFSSSSIVLRWSRASLRHGAIQISDPHTIHCHRFPRLLSLVTDVSRKQPSNAVSFGSGVSILFAASRIRISLVLLSILRRISKSDALSLSLGLNWSFV